MKTNHKIVHLCLLISAAVLVTGCGQDYWLANQKDLNGQDGVDVAGLNPSGDGLSPTDDSSLGDGSKPADCTSADGCPKPGYGSGSNGVIPGDDSCENCDKPGSGDGVEGGKNGSNSSPLVLPEGVERCKHPEDVAEGKGILICHVPSGSPENKHNICISINGAIHGHGLTLVNGSIGLHGGDTLGACKVVNGG